MKTKERYLVDMVEGLPVILLELEGSTIKKTYIYANSQILVQHDGSQAATKHFYLHDRLGSVRELIKLDGADVDVVNLYTYEPFGRLFATETVEGVSNPFKFAGYWYDRLLLCQSPI